MPCFSLTWLTLRSSLPALLKSTDSDSLVPAPWREEPGSGKRAAVIKRLICEESQHREKRESGGKH